MGLALAVIFTARGFEFRLLSQTDEAQSSDERREDPQNRMQLEEFVHAVAELLHLDQTANQGARRRW